LAKQAGPLPTLKKLPEILLDRSARIIARLEKVSDDHVSPIDCFKLWSYLGEMEYSEETRLYSRWLPLKNQFLSLMGTQKMKLVSCLEAGIREVLNRIELEHRKASEYYSKGGLGPKLTSYEFNDGLLGLRDQLGYAQLFLSSMGVTLAKPLADAIESEDKQLKALLPKALQQFRNNEDDPTPSPESFPESFWWRRIGNDISAP
jgi:hypothetical protein